MRFQHSFSKSSHFTSLYIQYVVIVQAGSFFGYRGFARQPYCMAGTIDSFSYGKKGSFLCKTFSLFLPCNMAAVQNLYDVSKCSPYTSCKNWSWSALKNALENCVVEIWTIIIHYSRHLTLECKDVIKPKTQVLNEIIALNTASQLLKDDLLLQVIALACCGPDLNQFTGSRVTT